MTAQRDLGTKLSEGQVVVIAGAGVSLQATDGQLVDGHPVASWHGLLRHGVEHAPDVDDSWRMRRWSQLETGDRLELVSVAEFLTAALGGRGGATYGRWLSDSVGGLKARRPGSIAALQALGAPIATTSYDSLIEDVTSMPYLTWTEGKAWPSVLRGDRRAVLHLHGQWRGPSSVMLGIRSYDDAITPHEQAKAMLRAMALVRTFLFVGVGTGLDDPNLPALFEWLPAVAPSSEYPHYRLVQEHELDYAAGGPDPDWIHPVVYGASHEELEPFLRNLAPPRRAGQKRRVRQPIQKGTIEHSRVTAPETPPRPKRRASQRIAKGTLDIRHPTAPEGPPGLLVFLCHSSADKPAVRRLERRLRADGMQTWLDELALVPGEDWDRAIREAVRRADIVVVCLSRGSVTKAGYVQKEIRFVLDIADEQPDGAIFVIPARLEVCDVPDRLSRWHWVDLHRRGGYNRLLAALRKAEGRKQ